VETLDLRDGHELAWPSGMSSLTSLQHLHLVIANAPNRFDLNCVYQLASLQSLSIQCSAAVMAVSEGLTSLQHLKQLFLHATSDEEDCIDLEVDWCKMTSLHSLILKSDLCSFGCSIIGLAKMACLTTILISDSRPKDAATAMYFAGFVHAIAQRPQVRLLMNGRLVSQAFA